MSSIQAYFWFSAFSVKLLGVLALTAVRSVPGELPGALVLLEASVLGWYLESWLLPPVTSCLITKTEHFWPCWGGSYFIGFDFFFFFFSF